MNSSKLQCSPCGLMLFDTEGINPSSWSFLLVSLPSVKGRSANVSSKNTESRETSLGGRSGGGGCQQVIYHSHSDVFSAGQESELILF